MPSPLFEETLDGDAKIERDDDGVASEEVDGDGHGHGETKPDQGNDEYGWLGIANLRLPSSFQHKKCKGTSKAWAFYRELVTPVKRVGGERQNLKKEVMETHICLLCIKDIGGQKIDDHALENSDTWKGALCRVKSTYNGTVHLISKHKHEECVIDFLEKKEEAAVAAEAASMRQYESEDESDDPNDEYMTLKSIKRASMSDEQNADEANNDGSNRFGYTDLGLPLLVKHHPCRGTSKVWSFFSELKKAIVRKYDTNKHKNNKSTTAHYTHVCLLCLKNVREDGDATRDSWQSALCRVNKTHNGLKHLKSKHKDDNSVLAFLAVKEEEASTIETMNQESMNYSQMMDHFRPIARGLAKHPQQRMFLTILEGIKNAVGEGTNYSNDGVDSPKISDC